MINEYVSNIEEACTEGEDFIIILKNAKKEQAIKKILAKSQILQNISGIMMKVKYKDKTLSIFITGKTTLRGVKNRKEAEETLEELLA